MIRSLIAVAMLAMPLAATAQTCQLDFDFVTDVEHGTLAANSTLRGRVDFTVDRREHYNIEGSDTTSYYVRGAVTIKAPDGTSISGDIGVVHIIRTPYTGDYISVDGRDPVGDLGGKTIYEAPMLVTVYSAPETLTNSELPKTTADWNVLGKRQVFQVHTALNGSLHGKISRLEAACD